MTTTFEAARQSLEDAVAPALSTETLRRRGVRRRRARTWSGVAALSLLAAAAVGTAVRVQARGGADSSPPPAGAYWLPQPLPPRFSLLSADRGGPVTPGFVARSADATQVFAVTWYGGTTHRPQPMSDPVTVGDHEGTISSVDGGGVDISLAWAENETVNVHAFGLDETTVRRMAASLVLPAERPPTSIDLTLPDPSWTLRRTDVSTAVTMAVFDPDVYGFATVVTVLPDHDAALEWLHGQVGPLLPRTVRGREVLVGHRSTNGTASITAAAVETHGYTVTVTSGDDGTLTDAVIDLALATVPVNDRVRGAALAAGGADRSPPCEPGGPTGAGVTVPGGPDGPVTFALSPRQAGPTVVLCVSDRGGAGYLSANALGTVQGSGNSAGWQLYGAVAPTTAAVRMEMADGITVQADTVAVEGFPGRVWLMNVPNEPDYRAMEELDASGRVVARHGRPPR